MRRIYLLLAILCCALTFYIGYQIGSPGETAEEDQIYDHLKELDHKLLLSARREDSLRAIVHRESEIIKIIDDRMARSEREIKITRHKYEKRIKELESYTASELDSFFILRYPSPGHITPDTSLESKNGRNRADSIRLSKNRIQEATEGFQGSESEIREQLGNDLRDILSECGEGSTRSFIDGEIQYSNEVPANLKEVQAPAEYSWSWISSSDYFRGS